MDLSADALTETMLISAYDIFHKHIDHPYNAEFVPQLAFLDSGGYETSEAHDDSTVFKFPSSNLPWTPEQLIEVIDSWSDRLPLAIVNFDNRGKSIKMQLSAATSLFNKFPEHFTDLLLKPTGQKTPYLDIAKILGHSGELRNFDALGFTEKELGDSLLDRMESIARVRRALDDVPADHACPIHVFGSLDPLTVCLYFVAGAEIFDGLSWLRYAYQDGVAVYNANYWATTLGIENTDEFIRGRILVENLKYLTNLKHQMTSFAKTGDFIHFGQHAATVQLAHAKLQSRLGGTV
jgi:hypothetical protein